MLPSETLPDRLASQTAIEPFEPTAIEAIERAILTRRSVRGFTQTPVPDALMQRIFALAQAAPSNCNVQPWRVYVASGEARNRLRDALVGAASSGGHGEPDFEHGSKFTGVYRKHQVECAVALYSELGIGRDDRDARVAASLRNFEFFDAPHVAFIGMSKEFKTTVALDVGMYVQTLMLLMTAHGIGCCAMGSLRHYPQIVRDEFGVPQDVGLLCGLSFGYEDTDHVANRTRTTRAELGDNVTFRA